MQVTVISAGAAKGLVEALEPQWMRETGIAVNAVFGAVGAMREKLLSGIPCDVLILTQPMLTDLANSGHVDGASIKPLGNVHTGIAVRAGERAPQIGNAEALKRALLEAAEIYFPDPERSTAGIHFSRIVSELGISEAVAPKTRPHLNGASAMRAMANSPRPGALGCTQVTEILYTEGVSLVGALPPEFELSTLYAAAVANDSRAPAAARMLIDLLTAPATEQLRVQGGFDVR